MGMALFTPAACLKIGSWGIIPVWAKSRSPAGDCPVGEPGDKQGKARTCILSSSGGTPSLSNLGEGTW